MILDIIQLALAILLILVILIQSKGSGLSGIFGGSSNVYRTKRGAEKFLHTSTVIISVCFLGLAFVSVLY